MSPDRYSPPTPVSPPPTLPPHTHTKQVGFWLLAFDLLPLAPWRHLEPKLQHKSGSQLRTYSQGTLCLQAEVDFSADGGTSPSSPQSAFVTCAASLTEGGQTSSHADDTRALMTVVLLGGISQDDLMVRVQSESSASWYVCNLNHLPHVTRIICLMVCLQPESSASWYICNQNHLPHCLSQA